MKRECFVIRLFGVKPGVRRLHANPLFVCTVTCRLIGALVLVAFKGKVVVSLQNLMTSSRVRIVIIDRYIREPHEDVRFLRECRNCTTVCPGPKRLHDEYGIILKTKRERYLHSERNYWAVQLDSAVGVPLRRN